MAKQTKNATPVIESPDTTPVVESSQVEKTGKLPGRMVPDFSAIAEILKEAKIERNETGMVISVPDDLNIVPILLKHTTIAGKNVSKMIDNLNDEDIERVTAVVQTGFVQLLKVAAFRNGTHKATDVRNSFVRCRENLNETIDKKLIASINNMLAKMPVSGDVSGKDVLSHKEISVGRGKVGISALAKIDFPNDPAVKNYDPSLYGLTIAGSGDKTSKIDVVELL